MIDSGVAIPNAHGQAMINTATEATNANCNAGVGPTSNHTTKVATAMNSTAGTNQRATASASRWMGALGRLGLADETNDLGEHRVAPHFDGPHPERAGLVEVRRSRGRPSLW